MSEDGPMSREREISDGLAAVRGRIHAAATAARRDPGEITLVVVTKFFPASDVRLLAGLGVTDVGENRHQEAVAKAAELAEDPAVDLRWHFIGGLQSNKAAAVAEYADVVESVDRSRLLPALARGAERRGGEMDVLLQVSLDPPGAAGRAGCDPAALAELAEAAASTEHLRLRGLMAVAPLGEDAEAAFDRLAAIRDGFRATHPDADWLSAGMSGDLEAAIGRGATHVRVGSAVLGPRPAIK